MLLKCPDPILANYVKKALLVMPIWPVTYEKPMKNDSDVRNVANVTGVAVTSENILKLFIGRRKISFANFVLRHFTAKLN